MLYTTLMLMMSSAFLMLRLAPGSNFPPPLSADEERAAVEDWMRGDEQARDKLIAHNLRLVAHIIKKYYARGCEPDDLISIGTIGLIKGVNTYRPDKNVRLATYASRCIENPILPPMRFTRTGGQYFSQAGVLLFEIRLCVRKRRQLRLIRGTKQNHVRGSSVPNDPSYQHPDRCSLLLHTHDIYAVSEGRQLLQHELEL